MTSGIYKIENAVNGRCYIGSAVRLMSRWATHRSALRQGRHANRYLQRAWDKHGEESFFFVVLESVADPEMLLDREQAHMDERSGKLYNLRPRAESNLGLKLSAATRAKIGAGGKGRKMSAEARAKLSAARMGMKFSDEHKANIRASKLGRKHSAESRAAMSEAQKRIGITNPALRVTRVEQMAKLGAASKGRTVSAETRAKISAANKVRSSFRYV